MKNILHVVNVYFVIPYFLGDQLLYFRDKGYNEFIACSPSEEIESYSRLKGFNYLETSISRSISPIGDLISIYKIYKYIRKNKIDIVVGHTPKGGMIAMISAFMARVPKRIYFRHGLVYETSTGIKHFILKSIDKLSAKLATKVVVVSPSVANKSIKHRLNNKEKQVVLGSGTCNGIDVARFKLSSVPAQTIITLKSKLNLLDSFVFGFVGRLVNDKGIVELVNAFNEFNKIYNKTKLLLVGMLEERDSVPYNIVQEIRNNSNIIVTGYVLNQNIEKYYALMDVFILPSYREGFPTSVLEASSMNLPVITTKVTGCVDSIIEHQTGIFVNHTQQSILNGMRLLYRDKKKRILLGNKGRDFVCKNFAQELIWKEIEKIYQ